MLLTMIAALAVGASNAPAEAKLTWHEFKPGDILSQSMPTMFYGLNPEGQKPPGYAAPPGLANPRFFTIDRRDGKIVVGVVGCSQPGGRIDRAWIDWNDDQKFESSEQAQLSTEPGKNFGPQTVTFTFPKAPKGPCGPIHARLLVVNNQMATLDPTGYMGGVVDLGGKPTKVAVIDANCDGVFGDTLANGIADCMALDTAGTGVLGQSGVTQIIALMQFPNGTFWTPVIAKDGSRISFVPDKTPTGSVEFKGGDLQGIALSNAKGLVSTRPVAGKVTAPAGSYTLTNAQFTLKDDAGAKWQYMVSQYNGPKLTVSAGQTSTVEIGSARLTLGSNHMGNSFSFSLGLKDKSGADVQGVYDPKGQRPAAPQLTITDPEGNVVKTMPFAYG